MLVVLREFCEGLLNCVGNRRAELAYRQATAYLGRRGAVSGIHEGKVGIRGLDTLRKVPTRVDGSEYFA